MAKQAVTYTALITVRNSGNGYVSEDAVVDIILTAVRRELLTGVVVSVFSGDHLSADRVGPYDVNEADQMERCKTKTLHYDHRRRAAAWERSDIIPPLDMGKES